MRRREPVELSTHFRSVPVRPMRVEPRIGGALFVEWRRSVACGAGSLLSGRSVKKFNVERVSFRAPRKSETKRCKFNIGQRARARGAISKMKRVPHIRHNRLAFIRKPPKFERASLLALYTPIFQQKVARSVLDKASGNLLFWYDNDRVKAGEKHHLLLVRVFGGEEPLKWIWVPA
ncbi:MAG: hypothetical protein LBS75_07070 [Synergistaceae bacterium]|nr:hypothetical protein [Synergistaceae bacterium]